MKLASLTLYWKHELQIYLKKNQLIQSEEEEEDVTTVSRQEGESDMPWDLRCYEPVCVVTDSRYRGLNMMGGTCGARGSDWNGVQNCSPKTWRVLRLLWGYNIKIHVGGPVALEYKRGSLRGVTAVFRAAYQIDVHYTPKLLSDIAYIPGAGGGRWSTLTLL